MKTVLLTRGLAVCCLKNRKKGQNCSIRRVIVNYKLPPPSCNKNMVDAEKTAYMFVDPSAN